MSSKARQRRNVKTKLRVNFDKEPPRCHTCVNFRVEVMGVPNQAAYISPHCNKHNIFANHWSICDDWQSTFGEVLE